MAKQLIHTDAAPRAIGPYAQATLANGMIYASGQLGLDPMTGALCEGLEAQTHQALRNLGAVLSAGGASFDDVVKTTVFLKNFDDFSAVNAIYESYFSISFPARSCVQVAKLPKDALIEIECFAVAP